MNRKKATRERKAPRKEGEDGYDPYDFDQSEASASEGTRDVCTAFAYCIQGKFCPRLFCVCISIKKIDHILCIFVDDAFMLGIHFPFDDTFPMIRYSMETFNKGINVTDIKTRIK